MVPANLDPASAHPPGLPDLDPNDLTVVPLARSETIPARWYTAPRFHAFDREAVLGTHWQYVGHANRLDRPGAYVTAEVAGDPVVVVHADDGTLKAFYNVCRHRGGPLATAACGHTRMLQCQYHGWTYRLDGALRGVPRFKHTELFDKRDFGLVPVHLAQWQGLLFVHLADHDGPAPAPLNTRLAGITERIAPLRLDTLAFEHRVVYDVACNWKVYVDNYLEGYHLPLVHPELCDVLDVGAYVTETADHYSLQYSPIRDGEDQYGTADGEAYYYFVFPNIMFNILPGRLQVNLVQPVAADQCRVVFDYYYADTTTPVGRANIARDLAFSDQVQQEDIGICEQVQRGLASRAYDRGRFSAECEAGVHHFQSLLKQAYRAALVQATTTS